MKYRYIFEKYGEIMGTNELTKKHLLDVQQNWSDFLIDTQEGTWFDAENNAWKPIKDDK